MKGFKITCNSCGNEIEITDKNIGQFVNEYAWGYSNFEINESTTDIAVFNTYDTCNSTMLCKCGNKVQE